MSPDPSTAMHARARMIAAHIRARGITDPLVLRALLAVPRHFFVPPALSHRAYEDAALPIGYGQTISQPYMVALMTSALRLRGGETVLEVGTGSGYQAAVLANIAKVVHTVERVPALAERARDLLHALAYTNVFVHVASPTTLGWPDDAPFDGILVAAAARSTPPTSLADQLADGARLVVPVGGRRNQVLTVCQRSGPAVECSPVCGCSFVPLIGPDGWER